LRDVCAEQEAWLEAHPNDETSERPLDALSRAHGLSEERPGRDDDWPLYGEGPRVVALAHQVIVHVPYTATMPRLFGELFFKHGGRVEIELDHAHEDLAVEFSFSSLGSRLVDAEERKRTDALERALGAVLPTLTSRGEHDKRPPIPPAFHAEFWKTRQVTAVFSDVVAGVEAVRAAAVEQGFQIRVRVSECPHGITDPLANLRATTRPAGIARVIVWSIGAERVRAMKALREVMGTELGAAKDVLEQVPVEVLVDVEQAYAERAAKLLRDAGCDAEAVTPQRR
jgi:ribosomal protein L7/L12